MVGWNIGVGLCGQVSWVVKVVKLVWVVMVVGMVGVPVGVVMIRFGG